MVLGQATGKTQSCSALENKYNEPRAGYTPPTVMCLGKQRVINKHATKVSARPGQQDIGAQHKTKTMIRKQALAEWNCTA